MPTSTPLTELLERVDILRTDEANPDLAAGSLLFVMPREHVRLIDARFLPPDLLVEAEEEPRQDGWWRVFWALDVADIHDASRRIKVQRWGYPETYPAVTG